MASNFVLYFKFCLIFHLITLILTEDDINQRTNSRCDQICNENKLNLLENYKPDCQRGCRYFNIEFLTTSGNMEKVTDLNYTQNQCKLSCTEAYEELSRRNACHLGCGKMYEIQSKAPYIHGWLVYMGASDRSKVLMQPDFDLVADDDWILLDAVFHPREYDNIGDTYKLTETRIQTMPIYPMRKNFTMEFCVPTWMWMIPILLVLCLVWMHYGNSIRNIFVYEDADDEISDHVPTSITVEKENKRSEDFIVALESYFYPSPSIPPPKYTEMEEAFLLNVSEDEEQEHNKNIFENKLINKTTA